MHEIEICGLTHYEHKGILLTPYTISELVKAKVKRFKRLRWFKNKLVKRSLQKKPNSPISRKRPLPNFSTTKDPSTSATATCTRKIIKRSMAPTQVKNKVKLFLEVRKEHEDLPFLYIKTEGNTTYICKICKLEMNIYGFCMT